MFWSLPEFAILDINVTVYILNYRDEVTIRLFPNYTTLPKNNVLALQNCIYIY
jgi:hypothetical protein